MQSEQDASLAKGLPNAGLHCPKCDYNLTGTTELFCPECGEVFNPRELRKTKSWLRSRPRWWGTLVTVMLATYLPNTWIFWINYPWGGGYRMHWVKMFPIMPILLPGAWSIQLFGLPIEIDQFWGMAFLGALCVGLIAAGYWIGRRSHFALLIVTAIMFALEVFNALGSYALFRM